MWNSGNPKIERGKQSNRAPSLPCLHVLFIPKLCLLYEPLGLVVAIASISLLPQTINFDKSSPASSLLSLTSTMTVQCSMELEDIHRWMPQEILEDIDIANPEELRSMVVVEELATRLTAVLGSQQKSSAPDPSSNKAGQLLHAPVPRTTPAHWAAQLGSRHQRRQCAKPLLCSGGLQRVALARPPLVGAVLPLAMLKGVGTGVFLPHTGAPNHHTVMGTKPLRNGPAESCKQRCRQKQCQHGHEEGARRQICRHAHRKNHQTICTRFMWHHWLIHHLDESWHVPARLSTHHVLIHI